MNTGHGNLRHLSTSSAAPRPHRDHRREELARANEREHPQSAETSPAAAFDIIFSKEVCLGKVPRDKAFQQVCMLQIHDQAAHGSEAV